MSLTPSRTKEIMDCVDEAINATKRERMHAFRDAVRCAVEQLEEDRQYHIVHLNRLASFMGFHGTSAEEIDEAIKRLDFGLSLECRGAGHCVKVTVAQPSTKGNNT